MLCNLGIESLPRLPWKLQPRRTPKKTIQPWGKEVQNFLKISPICIEILLHPPVWSLHGRNQQTSVPNVQTNKLDKSADKNALSNHCIHTNTAKLAIATKFLTGIFDEAQYWNIAKRQMVCGKDQRSLAQKNVEKVRTWKRLDMLKVFFSWLPDLPKRSLCCNHRISSTMRLSCMSIHSSIERRHRICFIFMPWPNRWEMAMNKRKQSAEIKRSATHRKVPNAKTTRQLLRSKESGDDMEILLRNNAAKFTFYKQKE